MKNVVDTIAEQFNVTKKLAGEIVSSVVTGIKNEILVGEKLRISGLGTFTVKEKPSRQGRNPKTGETITIEAKNVVTFKASSDFKATVNA